MNSIITRDTVIIDRLYVIDWEEFLEILEERGSGSASAYLDKCPRTKEFQEIMNSMPEEKIYSYWFIHMLKNPNGFELRVELRFIGLDPVLTYVRLALW